MQIKSSSKKSVPKPVERNSPLPGTSGLNPNTTSGIPVNTDSDIDSSVEDDGTDNCVVCKKGSPDAFTWKTLGAQCSTSQPVNKDQCKDSNARCTFSGSFYRCSCNDRYHQEGGVCVPDKAIGELCSNANECSDPNAECLGSKCTCDQQHYQYKPSGGAKDACEKVEQLQVTGISFSNIQTTQFTVSWTLPAGKESYISGFSVEWRPTDKSESGDTRNVSSASPQTLTGLTPGRTYEVKVISKNTATQPGSIRSTSSKKNQAAEPSKPGTVTSTLNDLDATDNSITIRWGTSVGVATQYRVKLIDGSTEVTSTISTSRSAVISQSTLKDGYIYTVHIEARSQAYDGNYIWSEKRISTIKTKVQVPDPPRNGVCQDPTDKSITLEWSEPADTKGDLVKYHIRVYHYYNTTKFIVSTTGTQTQKTVGNLDPGTSYTFRIYAENENYNSSIYNSVATGCKTKPKMSEPPTNLDITNVTSRSLYIAWMKPVETHSAENYGYVLQIKDDQDQCAKEIIYRCSDCIGRFQISNLDDLCSSTVRAEIRKTKQELEGQLTYHASLNPNIAYTVTVTAVNDAGRGYPANITAKTLEEAPQVPYGVAVSEIKTKSCN
ncbi:fibronectin-like [Mercenaria mercenaria]|uniref:fibronectin-like n=1 Tax=Mercenaria mercenaria TaxID=6596 RepID=UPI00234E70EB|nr:fibronectin-like [Mercenaria mercenaria]